LKIVKTQVKILDLDMDFPGICLEPFGEIDLDEYEIDLDEFTIDLDELTRSFNIMEFMESIKKESIPSFPRP